MLNISDLDYLDSIAPSSAVLGSAGTAIYAASVAVGDTSYTFTKTRSRTRQLPRGGSISISHGRAFGFASDPIDADVYVDVDGDADGQISIERTRSLVVDRGRTAFGRARGVFIAIDPPS